MTRRLTVLGTGYLGATHAVCMAELGFDVLGLDVNADKIARLNDGEVPFFEPGLDELLRKNVDAGTVRFTTSYDEVVEFGDVHFICAGTPQKLGEYAADLTQVSSVVQSLGPRLERECLVVGKSTVPSGTATWISHRLVELAPAGETVELAWNPEFLREGFAVEDTMHPDRLVFGVHEQGRGEQILREVYAAQIEGGVPVIVTDYATAELVKVAANAFLATKISFINAMAEVCEKVGGDVAALADALGHDSRIGRRFLHPGLGFGGGCLPKDIRAFMARAGELGVDQALSFLREVDAINTRRRIRMVDLARELVDGSFVDKRIAVLGAAFKPNSDDIRDSPALDVADTIRRQGGHVTVYDPAALDNARRNYPELQYADSAAIAARDADAVLHLTEWHEFTEMDPAHLSGVVRHKRIVDGRNALNADRWRDAGWTYRALGRP